MKNALVWGASGGIGQALVSALTEQGWTVVAVARNSGALTDLTPHAFDADVASAYAVEAAVRAIGEVVDEVALSIYAAGDIAPAKVAEMSPVDWQRTLDANLTGAFLTTHFSLPLLAPDAHLFYVGAVNERLRLPGFAAYGAAKAGLEAFGDALRKEQRQRKVTVVRPGAVDTPFWEKVPLRLPANAIAPATIAAQILNAYTEGTTGQLDL